MKIPHRKLHFSSLLLAPFFLAACNGKAVELPALQGITRLKISSGYETRKEHSANSQAVKFFSNPAQIARIVAILDKNRTQFRSYPGTLTSGYNDVEMQFFAGQNSLRRVTLVRGASVDELGKEYNIWVEDRAVSPQNFLRALISDADQQALFQAIGPLPPDPLQKNKAAKTDATKAR